MDTPLTPDQVSWIFESDENYEFAEEALEALLAGTDIGLVSLNDYDFTEESPEILAFEQDYRQRMSDSEISIFDSLNRLNQLDSLHSALLAENYAKIFFEDDPFVQYNGKGDAYRHALWNALGSLKLGKSLMADLTNAHEDSPAEYPYEYKEVQMDLFNNEEGRDIAEETIFFIMFKIKKELEEGAFIYLTNTTPFATEASTFQTTDQ